MFVVINRATASGTAYQIGFGFNDLSFRARKYEGQKFSIWYEV